MASPWFSDNDDMEADPTPLADMATSSFLLAMPEEIMHKICKEVVGDDEDTTSLAQLAQTCKGFSSIVAPVLYKHIKDFVPPLGIKCNRPNRLKLLSLLLSLQSNPKLGSLVRSITFPYTIFQPITDKLPNSQNYIAVVGGMFGIDASNCEGLGQPMDQMGLVSLCPNITTLQFATHPDHRDTDFLLNKNNRRVIGPRFTLTKLTALTVDCTSVQHGQGMNLHKLNGLPHCATRLESLTLERPRGGTSLTARLPHLTSLTLTSSYLVPRGLRMLLRACHNLTHFHLTPDKDVIRTRFLPASPAQVLEALAPAKNTLQRLHLATWIPRTGDPRAARYPLLERLVGFPALKQVAVDYRGIARRQYGDGQVLVELLKGCSALEGVFFFGVEGIDGREFQGFVAKVMEMEWTRLGMVKFQAGKGRWRKNEAAALWQQMVGDLCLLEREVRQMRGAGVKVVAVKGHAATKALRRSKMAGRRT